MSELRNLRVALLGSGSVGSQVARLLLEHSEELSARIGAKLELAGIAVRNLDAKRDVELPQELYTTDAERLILGADIVVEVMGGIEPARTLILTALQQGSDVITANKALLAAHGEELQAAADRVGAQLSYEAAVAGAIPIIRPLLNSLAGDNIKRAMGIVNGSTNYILDSMDRFGQTTEEAMKIASDLGYLEADPTLDVEGYDAAQKAAILARIAFHTELPADAVYREGITKITAEDIATAKQNGQTIKLLAVVERVEREDGSEGVSARVYPALISREHPLAAVHGGKNAIFVEAESAGELMFYGAGAGGVETASAVLGDLVSAARRHVAGGPGVSFKSYANLPVLTIGEILTAYQLRLTVADQPGVLQQIAGVFAENNVSLATVQQSPSKDTADAATLVIGTYRAREAELKATLERIAALDAVLSVDSTLRVAEVSA
ncbi:homoserine dehydrogenase [Canibacter zhoujuaniae]|uniref:homoserine dehydrogenase n=1 Tax=Canibacter zhoujuaniae TaxID=2708343 RepID=UPI0014249E0F|nr:homoserine dehydrogenase [Canibacter zhoujuaniae]